MLQGFHGFPAVNSKDSVKTYPYGGSLYIPGLVGSPDVLPENPSPYNEEFDAPLLNWSTLGTPDTLDANANGFKSHLHLAIAAPGTMQVHGGYKASPPMPFTVTAHIRDYLNYANYQQHGLMLLDSTPTKLFTFGPIYQSNNGIPEEALFWWNSRTSRAGGSEWTGTRIGKPEYLRMVVHSSTSIDFWYSIRGLIWILLTSAFNPGFTVANAGFCVTGHDVSVPCDCAVDWMRFT